MSQFFQGVCIAYYAELCISYGRVGRPPVCPSVRHTLALCQNNASYDHEAFADG